MNIKEILKQHYISFLIFLILLKHVKIINTIKSTFIKGKTNFFRKIKEQKINKDFSEEKGQLSLEFLLISLIAILIFVSVGLPLANIGLDTTFDISNSINTKSELSKIIDSINEVYSNGRGSKRTLFIEVPEDITINFLKNLNEENGYAIVKITLNDKNKKEIKLNYNANNLEESLELRKKINTKIIVEWPSNSKNIVVKKAT